MKKNCSACEQFKVVEVEKYKEILELHSNAKWTYVNVHKSLVLFNSLEEGRETVCSNIDARLKYLRFFLKPTNYKFKDWSWLHEKN